MLFDHQNLQPLYLLDPGKPGRSFAFEMARKIGLPEEVLHEAAEKVGEENVMFDKHLKEILRDKRYWENKRKKIRQTEKKLELLLEKYEKDMEHLQKQRKEILSKAKEEAEDMLSGVNRKIEETIRVIRETQAERIRTREARQELEKLKEKVKKEHTEEKDPVIQKLSDIRERRRRFSSGQKEEKEEGKPDIQVGDKVRMKGHEMTGEVLDMSQGGYLVAFGNLTTQVDGERLERVDGETPFRQGREKNAGTDWREELNRKRLSFRPEIDVRGKRAEEALREVTSFLDDAVMVGEKNLRIIHGKGNGILRQMIRDYLHAHEVVGQYHDEHVDRGGAGVTVVTLDM
jgi:DNA mismatch repair protein MutS2